MIKAKAAEIEVTLRRGGDVDDIGLKIPDHAFDQTEVAPVQQVIAKVAFQPERGRPLARMARAVSNA